MTEKRPEPNRTDETKAARAERDRRLAAALRDNLRRRKEQGRRRAEAPPDADPPEGEDR